MKIAFKHINDEYIVVVNDFIHVHHNSSREAWTTIFKLREGGDINVRIHC